MSWWQDFKDTRNYYRRLDDHRQKAEELRTELKGIEDTTPNYQDRERAMLRYRDAHAEEFSNAKPSPPAKMNALARWFSRKSVPTQEEEDSLRHTESLFSNITGDITHRANLQTDVDKREVAIGKGAQLRAQYTRDNLLPKTEQMGNQIRANVQAHHDAKTAALGSVNEHLEQKEIDRLSQSMMVAPSSSSPADVAAAAQENASRLQQSNILARQIKLRSTGSPEFNQEEFDKSVKVVAGYLKPVIQRINDFDLTQINTNGTSWVTEENLQAMHIASQVWMPASDLKKPGRGAPPPCPELLDALGINNPEFTVRARMMDTAQQMVRGRIAHDLGDSATKADYEKLVNPTANRETSLLRTPNTPNAPEPTVERISQDFAAATACTNAGFNGAKDYQGMVDAMNQAATAVGRAPLDLQQLNHPQIPQQSAKKMDLNQLGEATGSMQKPKDSQIAPKAPQKDGLEKAAPGKPRRH